MTGVEQPCYTLINFPTDSEPYNEMQLKHDLGKYYCNLVKNTYIYLRLHKGFSGMMQCRYGNVYSYQTNERLKGCEYGLFSVLGVLWPLI